MREDSRPLGSVTRLRVAAYLEDGDVVKTDRLSGQTRCHRQGGRWARPGRSSATGVQRRQLLGESGDRLLSLGDVEQCPCARPSAL